MHIRNSFRGVWLSINNVDSIRKSGEVGVEGAIIIERKRGPYGVFSSSKISKYIKFECVCPKPNSAYSFWRRARTQKVPLRRAHLADPLKVHQDGVSSIDGSGLKPVFTEMVISKYTYVLFWISTNLHTITSTKSILILLSSTWRRR